MQAPAWPPGTRHGYHAVTLGWYESELIRRVDPQRPHARPVLRRGDRSAARTGLPHRSTGLGRSQPHRASGAVSRTRTAAASQRDATALRGRNVQPIEPDRKGLLHRHRYQGAGDFNRDEIRKLSKCRRQRHGYRSVDRQTLRQRRNRRFPAGLESDGPRRIGGSRGAADQGTARQGDPHRHVVLSGLRQAHVQIRVRFDGQGLRMARSRWLVRIRRPGHRYRVRIRDEQDGLPHRSATRGNSRLRQALFRDVLGARTQI